MRIIFIGDTHGRDTWKEILKKEKTYDKVIFAGDYVSTHEGVSSEKQVKNLGEILLFKEKHPRKVILLRGNHDMQHLGYDWAECSGYFEEVEEKMMLLAAEFLENTQWVYVLDNIIFSHAGISKTWLKSIGLKNPKSINKKQPSAEFGFIPDHYSDYSGDSVTQPCTWIRPWSLAKDALDDYIQVVGHTPVMSIVDLFTACGHHIWLCDTLPFQYLVIEDGVFTPRYVNKEVIRLGNRYNLSVFLERLEDNRWILKGDESALTYIGVSFDHDKILSVDPSGGPFLGLGTNIRNSIISKIEELPSEGFIITLEDENKED